MAKLSHFPIINNPQTGDLCFSQRDLSLRISLLALNDVIILDEYYRI